MADPQISFFPSVCSAHQAPLTHFCMNGKEFMAVCESCWKFDLNLSIENEEDLFYGELTDAVDMAQVKIADLLSPFYDGIQKLQEFHHYKDAAWDEASADLYSQIEAKRQLVAEIVDNYFLEMRSKIEEDFFKPARRKSFIKLSKLETLLSKKVKKLEIMRNGLRDGQCQIKDLEYLYNKNEVKNKKVIENECDSLIERESASLPVIPRDAVETHPAQMSEIFKGLNAFLDVNMSAKDLAPDETGSLVERPDSVISDIQRSSQKVESEYSQRTPEKSKQKQGLDLSPSSAIRRQVRNAKTEN